MVRQSWQLQLRSEEATLTLGGMIAERLRVKDKLALYGNLGSGKTVLARGIIRGFCGRSDLAVPSPTYSLVQPYENSAGNRLWHLDLYRLKQREEVWEIGLDEALSEAITIIEWPEILGDWLPVDHLKIELQFLGESLRLLTVEMNDAWHHRLAPLLAAEKFTESPHVSE